MMVLQPIKQGRMFCDIIDVSHDPRVLSMWKALRVIVFHFMRPMAEHAQPAAVAQVQQHLQHNSRLVQEVFGPAYCNYKLHMINCRSVCSGLHICNCMSIYSFATCFSIGTLRSERALKSQLSKCIAFCRCALVLTILHANAH